MTITLNDAESKDYIAAQSKALELGIPFGQFLTKAIEYKTKIKSRDAIIAELKTALKNAIGSSTVTRPVATIPDLYAAQKQVQKEEEAAHKNTSVKAMTKPKTVLPEPKKELKKIPQDKLKCRLSKADKLAFHNLAEGKIKAGCSISTFALKKNLSEKTVLTYIKKHSNGQYTTIPGCEIKGSAIWPGASIHDNEVYFTMSN